MAEVVKLAMAPVAVALERHLDARLLTAGGFGLFAVRPVKSAFQTPQTGFAGMVWLQVVRGLAIMFCLLPPTRLAFGQLGSETVPDASGRFNLMRNLGGAIGLTLIETLIYSPSAAIGPIFSPGCKRIWQPRGLASFGFGEQVP